MEREKREVKGGEGRGEERGSEGFPTHRREQTSDDNNDDRSMIMIMVIIIIIIIIVMTMGGLTTAYIRKVTV